MISLLHDVNKTWKYHWPYYCLGAFNIFCRHYINFSLNISTFFTKKNIAKVHFQMESEQWTVHFPHNLNKPPLPPSPTHKQRKKREDPSFQDATFHGLHESSILKIGWHYFWPRLIALSKKTLSQYYKTFEFQKSNGTYILYLSLFSFLICTSVVLNQCWVVCPF